MADEKEKAQDKKKQEILREKAEKMGGTVVNTGGNMGAGKSGEIVMGGTEPTEENDADEEKERG